MSRRIEYALNQYALELSLPPMKMDDAGFASKIARTEFPSPTAPTDRSSAQRDYYFKRGNSFGALLYGDAHTVLKRLPDDCFNVAVTSPPYYWARDYGYLEQLGHEESVDEFVNNLANVFDEVKRVLHPEGVFFLNIGDTYYSGNGQPHGSDPRCSSRQFMRKKLRAVDRMGHSQKEYDWSAVEGRIRDATARVDPALRHHMELLQCICRAHGARPAS